MKSLSISSSSLRTSTLQASIPKPSRPFIQLAATTRTPHYPRYPGQSRPFASSKPPENLRDKMATNTFPPAELKSRAQEVAALLKEKGESVSVAETVCGQSSWALGGSVCCLNQMDCSGDMQRFLLFKRDIYQSSQPGVCWGCLDDLPRSCDVRHQVGGPGFVTIAIALWSIMISCTMRNSGVKLPYQLRARAFSIISASVLVPRVSCFSAIDSTFPCFLSSFLHVDLLTGNQAAGGLISASILSTPGASKIYKGGLTVRFPFQRP